MATPNDANFTLTDKFVTCAQVTVTVPTAGAGVTTAVTATVAGANLGDVVITSGPNPAVAHQVATDAFVSAANTVTISGTADATGFTGASAAYNLEIHHKS